MRRAQSWTASPRKERSLGVCWPRARLGAAHLLRAGCGARAQAHELLVGSDGPRARNLRRRGGFRLESSGHGAPLRFGVRARCSACAAPVVVAAVNRREFRIGLQPTLHLG